MPRLPLFFDQPRAGLTQAPRLRVGIPTTPIPEYNVRQAGQLGQALGTLAQGLESGASLVMQGRQIEAQRQEAQDILDSKMKEQEAVAAAQEWTQAQIEQGDYRTLPKDMEQRFKDLEYQMSADLSPGAKKRFSLAFKHYTNTVMPKLHQYRNGRMEEDRKYAYGQEFERIAQGMSTASTPQDLAYYEQRLEETLATGVAAGLIDGAKAAHVPTVLRQNVAKQRAQHLNRTQPLEAWQHWQDLMAGGPGTPGMPGKDFPELWAGMADEARQQHLHGLNQAEHAQRSAERQVTQAQKALSMEYRAQIVTLDPTPENLPQLQAILMNATRYKDDLGDTEYTQITGLARSYINAAKAPKEQDDPVVEERLRLHIAGADTTAALQDAEKALWIDGPGNLKPETFSTLQREVARRLDRSDATVQVSYRSGVAEIKRAVMDTDNLGLGMALLGNQEKTQLLNALDEFTYRYRALAERSQSQADREATGLALDVRLKHFPAAMDKLPPEVQAVQSEAELGALFQKYYTQGYPQAVLEEWRRAWTEGRAAKATADKYRQEQMDKAKRGRQ